MADQYWVRVVGFLQPPPAREVLYTPSYYRGGNGQPPRGVPDQITAGDLGVYRIATERIGFGAKTWG